MLPLALCKYYKPYLTLLYHPIILPDIIIFLDLGILVLTGSMLRDPIYLTHLHLG